MISHLLGIATAKLNNPTKQKIKFIYLLYNPSNITIINPKHTNKILEAYNTQISECSSISFSDLFNIILDYLNSVKNIGIASKNEISIIKSAFSFELCNQNDYILTLNKSI